MSQQINLCIKYNKSSQVIQSISTFTKHLAVTNNICERRNHKFNHESNASDKNLIVSKVHS